MGSAAAPCLCQPGITGGGGCLGSSKEMQYTAAATRGKKVFDQSSTWKTESCGQQQQQRSLGSVAI